MAYCMLGIFSINMPLLYGEGSKAFIRLQEEIIRTSNDHTIFCWTWTDLVPREWASLLAPCPQAFKYSNKFVSNDHVIEDIKLTYKMTNAGLSINLPIVQSWRYYLGILNAQYEKSNPADEYDHLVCVPLDGLLTENREMRRGKFPPGPVPIPFRWKLCQLHVYISSNPRPNPQKGAEFMSWPTLFGRKRHSFLLVFGNTEKLVDDEIRGRDWNRSELSPGNRVCLLETKRPLLEVFPSGVFDEERSLVTLDHTSLPQGFLIRIGMSYPRCFFFIGIGTRSHKSDPLPQELYRVYKIVPRLHVKEVSSFEDLLAREIDSMKLKDETCEESSRYGLQIKMREEAVTETDSICLIYIVCEETKAG